MSKDFLAPPSKPQGFQQVSKAGLVGKSQHEFIKLSKQTTSSNSNMAITEEQLSMHVDEDDAWTSLDGVVYNVTSYLKHHPGGKAILLKQCGKECQEQFYKHHPWVNAKYLLEKFKMGHLTKG